MIRKLFSVGGFCAFLAYSNNADAQNYKNAIGLRLDLGEGSTLVGPAVKHFFSPRSAGEFSVLFGDNTTMLGAEYQYHGPITNAGGLQWYAGGGASVGFFRYFGYSQTDIWLRPLAGLDYKIGEVPLNFAFDWRPMVRLTHGDAGNRLSAARFGLAARYTF